MTDSWTDAGCLVQQHGAVPSDAWQAVLLSPRAVEFSQILLCQRRFSYKQPAVIILNKRRRRKFLIFDGFISANYLLILMVQWSSVGNAFCPHSRLWIQFKSYFRGCALEVRRSPPCYTERGFKDFATPILEARKVFLCFFFFSQIIVTTKTYHLTVRVKIVTNIRGVIGRSHPTEQKQTDH